MNSIRKFWRCCGRQIRTNFCQECGAQRPGDTITVDAEMMLDEFYQDMQRSMNSATALYERAQIETIQSKHYWLMCTAGGLEKRFDKFQRWATILKNLIDMKSVSEV